MNRQEFIKKLQSELSKLPKEEVQDIIDYYNEYFDEAGAENEEAVLKELGNPLKIAAQIKSDFAVKHLSNNKYNKSGEGKKGIAAIWWIILGIFTAPIAFPLALAGGLLAIAILLTIGFTLLAVLFCIGAFFISGIFALVIGIPILFVNFANGIFSVGAGLVLMGGTAILGVGVVLAARKLVQYIARKMDERRQTKASRKEEEQRHE